MESKRSGSPSCCLSWRFLLSFGVEENHLRGVSGVHEAPSLCVWRSISNHLNNSLAWPTWVARAHRIIFLGDSSALRSRFQSYEYHWTQICPKRHIGSWQKSVLGQHERIYILVGMELKLQSTTYWINWTLVKIFKVVESFMQLEIIRSRDQPGQ